MVWANVMGVRALPPSTHLIQLAALFDQSLLGLVALLQCPVQLLILAAEALQALIAHELLQHLRSTRRRSKANAKHAPPRGSRRTSWKSLSSDSKAPVSKPAPASGGFSPSACRSIGDALRETVTATAARAAGARTMERRFTKKVK